MGISDMRVYVLDCDGCEYAFEGKFGDTYFEFDTNMLSEAKSDGWDVSDQQYADAFCPDCVAKRKRAEAGLPELVAEIPGQLDLLAEVAA